MERFDDVVIGAGVEALHLGAHRIQCGEHQHRHRHVVIDHTDASAHIHPSTRQSRQHQIQNDQVVSFNLKGLHAVGRGVGDVDGVTGFGKGATDDVRDADVIFDHK